VSWSFGFRTGKVDKLTVFGALDGVLKQPVTMK